MPADINLTIQQVLAPFGGAKVVLPAVAVFVGGIIATLIAHELRATSEVKLDALTRRRDVYSRLATGMRVFINSGVPAATKEKQDFMIAYDQGCVWASEPVIEKLGSFLDVMERFNGDSSPEAMRQRKDAYAACILAMRRDAGFPSSDFRFRFVSFEK